MWDKKLDDLERLINGGHYKQAVQEAGSVLEEMMRELYRLTFQALTPAEQKAAAEVLEKIGNGKPVDSLTLGQLAGLFRECKLFDKAEKPLNRALHQLKGTNFNPFVELRN